MERKSVFFFFVKCYLKSAKHFAKALAGAFIGECDGDGLVPVVMLELSQEQRHGTRHQWKY